MPRFKQVRVPALEGKVNFGPDTLHKYTAEVPAEVVATFRVERVFEVEGGFQRGFDKARTRKIGTIMGGDKKKGIDPKPNIHGALIVYADESEIAHRGNFLTIKKPLRILDGQTRAGGCEWALEHNGEAPWTETVEIIQGAPYPLLAEWFLTINMTSRKVDPGTILLDLVKQEEVFYGKRPWLARHTQMLAVETPFFIEGETPRRIVSFAPRDGGVMKALVLYKTVNFMLPPDLNKPGEVEGNALAFARDAFKLYAGIYPDSWGKVDDDGKLVKADCYSFTLMAAFGRVYRQAVAQHGQNARTDAAIRRSWAKAGLDKGQPEGTGSGERAAVALASYVAGEMNLKVEEVAA